MWKLALVIACTLSLLFPSTAQSSQHAQYEGKHTKYVTTPLAVAKFISGFFSSNSRQSDLDYSDLDSFKTKVTYSNEDFEIYRQMAETIANIPEVNQALQKLASAAFLFVKANPLLVIGLLSASATSAAASYSYNTYAEGTTYAYSGTDQDFREKIETAKEITQIELLSSPTEGGHFQHYQIIFEMDSLIWARVSFGIDGLQAEVGISRQSLVKRRKKNSRIAHKEVRASTQRIRHFLKLYQGQKYHFVEWNCQDFSVSLWNTIIL